MNYFINKYKNSYITKYENQNLLINLSSCSKVSNEVAFLIDFLPKKADRTTYLKCLGDLEINNCENVFNKLLQLGVLEEKNNLTVKYNFKKIINKIFSPKIQIFPSAVQKKIFSHRLFSISKTINEDLLVKIILFLIITLSIAGLFLNKIFASGNLTHNYSFLDSFCLLIFTILGIIIHELGHSCMCHYCGIGFRPIGFSIYLIYPVMFTNVSGINELDLKKRILINSAGLFAQGIYMICLTLFFFATKYYIFSICIQLMFVMFYFNLHPFLRTDGYWFLKDILYFSQNNQRGKLINDLYQILYFLFSAYLIYKGFLLLKTSLSYFLNLKKIQLNGRLLVNLFSIYIVIILAKALKNRFTDFYHNFIEKKF